MKHGQKDYLNNGKMFSKYVKGNGPLNTRSLVDPKWNQHKEVYIKTYYNQIVKSQKQREDFENSKEKSHLLQIQECS
jgi:hypothetical protein